jgi:tetratricopeptide (TPR) repeat protein
VKDVEAGLRIGGALREFWEVRGYLTEGRGHLEGLLALPAAQARTAGRAKALRCAARLTMYLGNRVAARALYEESLAIFRELGMKRDIAWTLAFLGWVHAEAGQGAAQALYEESLAIFRELGDKFGIADGLNSLGGVARRQGDYRAARALGEESLAIYRELGYKRGIISVLGDLARLSNAQGDGEQARALGEESLALSRELGMKLGITGTLNILGIAARHQGENAEARVHFEESLALSRELGNRYQSAQSLLHLARMSQAEEDWAKARALYDESLTIYRELGIEQGVAWALHELPGACMGQGEVLLELGDYAAARARFEEGLALRRATESKPGVAWALVEVGHAAWLQGEHDVTQSHAVEALTLFQELGNTQGILAALESLAVAALAEGQKERAARLLGAVEALHEALELPGPDRWRRPRERMRDAVRAVSLEEAFAEAWTEGRAMSLAEAMTYAAEGLSTGEGI